MIESKNPITCPEIIEKQGKSKINTFNDKFDFLQIKIIEICKNDSRACVDYGYLYLKLLERQGVIKINFIPNKILSPETPNRILRHLKEMSNFNEEISFLMKYQKGDNLNKESKEFYRID